MTPKGSTMMAPKSNLKRSYNNGTKSFRSDGTKNILKTSHNDGTKRFHNDDIKKQFVKFPQ